MSFSEKYSVLKVFKETFSLTALFTSHPGILALGKLFLLLFPFNSMINLQTILWNLGNNTLTTTLNFGISHKKMQKTKNKN